MKTFLIGALVALISSSAWAQTTTQTSASGASAGAVSNINLIQPGNGGGSGNGSGVGYLNTNNSGTQWILGGTPSMNTTQYDACTKYISASALLGGVSIPLEIDTCWKMRQADAIAKYPPGSVQYNLLCADSGILQNDWDTGTMKCTANQAKLRKANPNDPRTAAYQGVPVVAVSGPGINAVPSPNATAPAGGAAKDAPTFTTQAAPLPRCSATVRDRCISG